MTFNILYNRYIIVTWSFKENRQFGTKKSGNLILENRQKLSVSGICDVESFSTDKIMLLTDSGTLTISGSDMRVKKLSAESGEAIIEGEISGCVYKDGQIEKESFLKRVLK